MDRSGIREADGSGRAGGPSSVWLIEGGRVRVAEAGPDELAIAAEILDEVSAWLDSLGLAQWPRPFPVPLLEVDRAKGIIYLAWDGIEPVGTFALHRTDTTFWGGLPAERPGHAIYVHKLAVRRGNRGLGRALVDLAVAIGTAAGASCLRLDCMAGNPKIRRYYEELGFEHRGDIDVPALTWRASLYERRLG